MSKLWEIGKESWRAAVHRVAKSQTRLKNKNSETKDEKEKENQRAVYILSRRIRFSGLRLHRITWMLCREFTVGRY